ncbi:receptor-type tyrosine-protein phosphatase N2 isoform X6 [Pectinophora gossypiella]|uniref:receptor-type tyrosine-protein phosphatase N2 isoform X6 n=1 Tax=Pectinophora gossypiella TaxID=13191 RepID=UPI00214EEDB2|nr:receptor-type tyrosine-protein phosphatase N2 isoform X6 [Pectinophora gossypiella]
MCHAAPRQALWVLALLCALAPSHADGNIGCLFSSSLCVERLEWCYDDFAFGRCIPIFEDQTEDLYRYDMSSEQLKWFEEKLQRLAARGYRWEHAYTQCVLQAMLYTMRQDLDPTQVNPKICDHFVDPKLPAEPVESIDPIEGVKEGEGDPDETAYVRFTPNSDSDFADEVYSPPDDIPEIFVPADIPITDEEDMTPNEETPSDKIRDLIMNEDGNTPVIVPFEGFRERIQAEKAKDREFYNVPSAEKKSLPEADILQQGEPNDLLDEERLAAHLPHVAAKTQKLMSGVDHDHNQYDYDPSYAYVTFKNRFGTDWEKGISFIARLEEMLGLEKNTFTNPRVDPGEVTFKVEKNNKGYSAHDVATHIEDVKEELQRETGAQVLSTGVGDRSKRPVIRHVDSPETLIFGLELPVLLALVGSLSVLVVGGVVFGILLKRDMNAKRKMQGLATAAEIDTEATRDYQELCRARMSGKWTGQTTASPHPADQPQRITSLSREPTDGNSPSTRSSTSSWSEEPALTNMDISTGHMVLAYMEDHLRNKDRLEQEWRALCAYEAEPCASTAALKPENTGKNRYADVLPYDHSRVTLNTLSNHLGSDYINASTITDHDPRNPAYIAAAGPLAQTAPDFWQMVWEQGSVVMVMLTRLTENGQQLCHRYWPEEGSELYHIYEVHLVSEHIWCDDYLVRSFYLKNQRTGETRTVTQFHFLSWPENGVPSSTKALLEFRRKVNKSYRGRSCPIVVHCSDGAGRTGTYCLIDMVLNRMAKGAKEIDIAATLEHIRDQRARTVATKQQFEFVLMAVAEEVHAILKALPAHLQQLQEKKDKEKEKEKEKEKDGDTKEKPN